MSDEDRLASEPGIGRPHQVIPKIRIAAIVGPTAAGKTEASLEVAEKLGAEIVSVDSMQIYKGMDIGTAKPPAATRERVRHHLVDEFDPSKDVTVAEFQSLARAAIADIAARKRIPLLVGGSGLYFKAVVDDLEFPPRSAEVRSALEEEADELGAEVLHERLRSLDPAAASRMEPGNTRRIVRALEVIELTGRPFSDNDSWDRSTSLYAVAVAALKLPRDLLFERIGARVDRMLEEGLVEETKRLEAQGLGRTARQALGYRQILEAGPEASVNDIRDEIVRATKRFARRQESWFRADHRFQWFDGANEEVVAELIGFFSGAIGAGSA